MKYAEYTALCEELYEEKIAKDQFIERLITGGIERSEAEKIYEVNTDGFTDAIALRVDESENIIGIQKGEKR